MRLISALSLVLLPSLLGGCTEGAEREASARVITSDSAGVTIVDNGEIDPLVRGFQIDTTPLFRVGWSEHPDSIQFRTIRGGAVLSSGYLAVADRAEVHIFRRDGSLAYSVGGAGEGPGEFQVVGGVVAGSSDTLVVQDQERGRVAIFAGADLVADFRLRYPYRVNRNVVQGVDGGVLILPPIGSGSVGTPTTGWNQAPVPTERSTRS